MIREMKEIALCNQAGEAVAWTHLDHPSPETVASLSHTHGFPKDFVLAGTDPHEPPRQETFVNDKGQVYTLYVFRYPVSQRGNNPMNRYQTLPLAIVLSESLILITGLGANHLIEAILHDLKNQDPLSPTAWLMKVFWMISRRYIHLLEDMDTSLGGGIEKDVATSTRNKVLYDLIGLNKGLIYFETAIDGNAKLLEAIGHDSETHPLTEREKAFLHDIQIDHHKAWTLVHQYKDMVDKLTDMLSNVISNNMN